MAFSSLILPSIVMLAMIHCVLTRGNILSCSEPMLRSRFIDSGYGSGKVAAAKDLSTRPDVHNTFYGVLRITPQHLIRFLGPDDYANLIGIRIGSPLDWTKPHHRFIAFIAPCSIVLPLHLFFDHKIHFVLKSPKSTHTHVSCRGISVHQIAERLEQEARATHQSVPSIDSVLQAMGVLSNPHPLPRPPPKSASGPSSKPLITPVAAAALAQARSLEFSDMGAVFQFKLFDQVYELLSNPLSDAITSLKQSDLANLRRYKTKFCIEDGQLMRIVKDGTRRICPRLTDLYRLFQKHHLPAHHGITRMTDTIRARYYVRGLRDLISDYVGKCTRCLLMRQCVVFHNPGAFYSQRPLERVQVDLTAVGKFMHDTSKHSWLLVVIDHFSGYTWIKALKTKDSAPIADFLFESMSEARKEVASRFGQPISNFYIHFVQSDNGSEFVSRAFASAIARLNAEAKHGKPYTPQHQGKVERANQSIKKMLNRLADDFPAVRASYNWADVLPYITMRINHNEVSACTIIDPKGQPKRLPITPHSLIFGTVIKASFRAMPNRVPEKLKMHDPVTAAKGQLAENPALQAEILAGKFGLGPIRYVEDTTYSGRQWQFCITSFAKHKVDSANRRVSSNFKRECARMVKEAHGLRYTQAVNEGSMVLITMPRSARMQVRRSFKEWLPLYIAFGKVVRKFQSSADVDVLARSDGAKLDVPTPDGLYPVDLHLLQHFDLYDGPPKVQLLSMGVRDARLSKQYSLQTLENPLLRELADILRYDNVQEQGAPSVMPDSGLSDAPPRPGLSAVTPTHKPAPARTPASGRKRRSGGRLSVAERVQQATARARKRLHLDRDARLLQLLGELPSPVKSEPAPGASPLAAPPSARRVSRLPRQLIPTRRARCSVAASFPPAGFKWADNQCSLDSIVMALFAASLFNSHIGLLLQPSSLPTGPLHCLSRMVQLLHNLNGPSPRFRAFHAGKALREKTKIVKPGFSHRYFDCQYGTLMSYEQTIRRLCMVDSEWDALTDYDTQLVENAYQLTCFERPDNMIMCAEHPTAHRMRSDRSKHKTSIAHGGQAFSTSKRDKLRGRARTRAPPAKSSEVQHLMRSQVLCSLWPLMCGHDWMGPSKQMQFVTKSGMLKPVRYSVKGDNAMRRAVRAAWQGKAHRVAGSAVAAAAAVPREQLETMPADAVAVLVGLQDFLWNRVTAGTVRLCSKCDGPARKVMRPHSRLPPLLLWIGHLAQLGGGDAAATLDNAKAKQQGGRIVVGPPSESFEHPSGVTYRLVSELYMHGGHATCQFLVPNVGWFFYDDLVNDGKAELVGKPEAGPVHDRGRLDWRRSPVQLYARRSTVAIAGAPEAAAHVPKIAEVPVGTVRLACSTMVKPEVQVLSDGSLADEAEDAAGE